MKKKVIFAVLAAFFLSGCGKEAITVAGIQSEDGQTSQYIEMQEFEIKEQVQEIDREEEIGRAHV